MHPNLLGMLLLIPEERIAVDQHRRPAPCNELKIEILKKVLNVAVFQRIFDVSFSLWIGGDSHILFACD